MPIIPSILNWLTIKRLHQIELFKKYPFDVQQEVLLKLLEKAKETEWGKKYDFESILTTKDYCNRVPIQTYESLNGEIKRLLRGEQNILWPSKIKWFAKSSGTTNDKSKFIPVSIEALEDCHYRGGRDVMAIYSSMYPETKLFKGKGLTLGGSHQISGLNDETYYGDLSAILIQNLPFWMEFIKTPNQEIALMDQWEQKLKKLAMATMQENVTSLAGVPSWMLVLIKYILAQSGKRTLLEIWPNLELFIHGGVSFIPYREQYMKLIPSREMHYMETYNASEGFFAIQDEPAKDDMLLMLDIGVYYEFIPMEEVGKEFPCTINIGEVEKNKNYAIVITTNSGLWRYMIGDTIKFTSLYPHKIKVTGRTKHYLNVFGEEVIIDNADKALKIACERTGAIISEYTAGPVFMSAECKGTHEWMIEFEKDPADIELFRNFLDEALMSLNSDYEAKRYKDITLEKPLIRTLRKGTFYNWLQEKNKLGGQNKVPRLSNERKYLEELSAIEFRE
jgi:GH3 auxin-responsive promoter